MRLHQIEITDFLSIKGHTEVNFDSRVTVLLGSNDHGKSNILTALLHANDDIPIKDEEVNWDATETSSLSFHFRLDESEQRDWKSAVDEYRASTESSAAGESASELPARSPSADPPTPADAPIPPASPAPSPSQPLALLIGGPRPHPASLNPSADTITFVRTGVGAALLFNGVPLAELPPGLSRFFVTHRPRFELFKVVGALPDSATAATIDTQENEFLQGVFFYAGLDPKEWPVLFTQSDRTMRTLQNASLELDQNLRQLWEQGTDLHFALQHRGESIEFLADDPAIKTRKARMSKRSDGVTQFFRISMILAVASPV